MLLFMSSSMLQHFSLAFSFLDFCIQPRCNLFTMRNLLAHVFAIQNNAVEQREGNKRWRQKNGCGGVGGVRASGGG